MANEKLYRTIQNLSALSKVLKYPGTSESIDFPLPIYGWQVGAFAVGVVA
jgi:hypothetical protein